MSDAKPLYPRVVFKGIMHITFCSTYCLFHSLFCLSITCTTNSQVPILVFCSTYSFLYPPLSALHFYLKKSTFLSSTLFVILLFFLYHSDIHTCNPYPHPHLAHTHTHTTNYTRGGQHAALWGLGYCFQSWSTETISIQNIVNQPYNTAL